MPPASGYGFTAFSCADMSIEQSALFHGGTPGALGVWGKTYGRGGAVREGNILDMIYIRGGWVS